MLALYELILLALIVGFVGGVVWAIIQAHEEIEGVNEPRTYVHKGKRIKR